MSDTQHVDAFEQLALKVQRLEQQNRDLRQVVGRARGPNALWLAIGVLLLIACVAMVVPMDDDGVNDHADGAIGVFFLLVVPITAAMLVMGARIIGIPLIAAVITALVLLHKERSEVFSEPNAVYWIAFAALTLLAIAAALAAVGVPLTRAVVPGLAQRGPGYLQELKSDERWWHQPPMRLTRREFSIDGRPAIPKLPSTENRTQRPGT